MRQMTKLAYLLVVLALSADLDAQQRSRIRGEVTDRQGNPVTGATVIAENPKNMPATLEKTTDDGGRFTFGGLQTGNWKLTVKADGFLTHETTTELGLGQNLRIDIVLDTATGAALLATSAAAQKEIDQAAARFQAGDYDGAIELFSDLLARAPEVHQIHFNLALSYERKGDYGKAAEHYQSFVDKEPDNFDAQLNLANALSRSGKKEEAIAHYEACTRLQPENAVAFFNLGLALFETEKTERAGETFDEALKLDPDLVDAYFMRGNVHLRTGEIDDARRCYEKFLELAPDSPLAGPAREALEQLKKP